MFLYIVENAIALAICLFAIRAGGSAERLAGFWFAASITVYVLLMTFQQASPTLSLVNDGVFAVGLLPLAMIFVSWGIGVMTLIQAFSFAVEAFYLLTDRPIDGPYLMLMNWASVAIALTLLGSTVASILHRRAAGNPSAPASA
jgi:hypothetical protein